MPRRVVFCIATLAWALAAQTPGRTLDAIAAVVNGRAITTSEVADAAWYARLSERLRAAPPDAPAPLTEADRRRALEHVIAEVLVEQQAGYRPGDGARVQAQWRHLAGVAGGEVNLERWCARYHLVPATVRRIVGEQLGVLAAVDARLQSQAQVTSPEIARYYRDEYVPQARRRGLRPLALAQASPLIREILMQRQLVNLQTAWLARLRETARVHILRP